MPSGDKAALNLEVITIKPSTLKITWIQNTCVHLPVANFMSIFSITSQINALSQGQQMGWILQLKMYDRSSNGLLPTVNQISQYVVNCQV